MVSLKSSSIMAAVLIKTFIVLSTIDCVSSLTERELCQRLIENLYNENDPYRMFRKGFLAFSQQGIEDYNRFLPEEHHNRLQKIVQSIITYKKNLYTKGYFLNVLTQTAVQKKYTLPIPSQFCARKFINNMRTCRDIIHQKLLIDPTWSGNNIFDFFYKTWSKKHIELQVLFYKEIQNVENAVEGETDLERAYRMTNDIKLINHNFYRYIEHYYKKFEDIVNEPKTEVERCTSYIKNLYKENDSYKMFKKGFLLFNKSEIEEFNCTHNPGRYTEHSDIILQSMHKYTGGYFIEVVQNVTIVGKDELQNPEQFCKGDFNDKSAGQEEFNTTALLCTSIIYQKLLIDPSWSGSDVFDFLYTKWTKNHIDYGYFFREEHKNVVAVLEGESLIDRGDRISIQIAHYKSLFGFIKLYYNQFEKKVNARNHINVDQMPSPGQYCSAKISKMANLNVN